MERHWLPLPTQPIWRRGLATRAPGKPPLTLAIWVRPVPVPKQPWLLAPNQEVDGDGDHGVDEVGAVPEADDVAGVDLDDAAGAGGSAVGGPDEREGGDAVEFGERVGVVAGNEAAGDEPAIHERVADFGVGVAVVGDVSAKYGAHTGRVYHGVARAAAVAGCIFKVWTNDWRSGTSGRWRERKTRRRRRSRTCGRRRRSRRRERRAGSTRAGGIRRSWRGRGGRSAGTRR